METTSEVVKYGLGDKLVGVTRVKTCKTKLDDSMTKEESVATTITINMSDLTIGELIDKYAIAKMVIERQKVYREKGVVPEVDNYTPSPETTRAPQGLTDKQIDNMSPEMIELAIQKLMNMQSR